jgi:hypothetical protein
METCKCCGQKIRPPHRHNLTRGLVDTLIRFAKLLEEKGVNNLHLLTAGFSISQTNNFQKLRYFGLVAKGKETGYWVLTKRGQEFLNGEVAVSKWVETKDNLITERSVSNVFFKEAKKSKEYWQTDFNLSISNYEVTDLPEPPKYRTEYRIEERCGERVAVPYQIEV